MLLCDGCDRGHHMYCLKPKIKNIPEGDWYCSDCKPKERVRSPKKKSRRVFSSAEEEATDDEQEDDDNTEEEEEEEDMEVDEEENSEQDSDEDDDDIPLKKKAKKKVAAAKVTKAKKGKKLSTISQLFGKRRCAAEANEKIARVTQQEIASGNSSGSESASDAAAAAAAASRSTRASRAKRSLEQPLSTLAAPVTKSSPPGSGARSKRRKAVDDEIYGMFNPTVLEDLLNAMMKHRDGWPFDRPITKADAPDYHKIIKKPMDLGTIRSSINRMKYSCNQEVLEDIEMVFKNCRTYNRDDAEEYMCGVRLEKYFRKEAKKAGLVFPDEEEEISKRPPAKKARRTF